MREVQVTGEGGLREAIDVTLRNGVPQGHEQRIVVPPHVYRQHLLPWLLHACTRDRSISCTHAPGPSCMLICTHAPAWPNNNKYSLAPQPASTIPSNYCRFPPRPMWRNLLPPITLT